MRRRELLGAAVGTMVASKAQAAPRRRAGAHLADGLEAAATLSFGVPPTGSTLDNDVDSTLIRSAMRTVFVAGAVRDMDEDERHEDDVATALADFEPEADHAVNGVLLRMETLSAAERASVVSRLRDDPDIARRAGSVLTGLASETGSSLGRRLHLDRIVRQVVWTVQHRPFDAVLSDAIHKIHRQAEITPPSGPRRRNPQWDQRHARLETFLLERGEEASEDDSVPVDGPTRAERMRKTGLRELGWSGGLLVGAAALLGIAALSSAETAISIPALTLGLVALTASAVLLIVGLVTLIIANNFI